MTRLGPFELQKRVARGGMAVVWRGVHVEQQLPVAVKIMSERLARKARHRREFFNEVRAVARLDHPKVVSLLDFGEVPEAAADPLHELVSGSPWLAMEWIEGRTLADATVWSWSRLESVVQDVLDALAHAHARGVIHRDLKPANVMFAMEGDVVRVKLTDFGIARHSDSESGDDARVRGTPNYMAPEQILGMWREHGPCTDLYALGCVMWRILTGRSPYQRADQEATLRAHLVDPLPDFEPTIAVPAGIVDFLRHLLARTPSRRFQYAADAAAALAVLPEAPESKDVVGDAFADTIVDVPTISVPVETLSVETAEEGLAPTVATPKMPDDWHTPSVESARLRVVRAGLNLFPLRETPFVDRDTVRDELWRALREVVDTGGVRTVVLEGPLGVGKTRLARWLTERAHEVGAARPMWVYHSEGFGESDGIRPLVSRVFGLAGLTQTEVENRVARYLFGTTRLDDAQRLDVQGVLRLASSHDGPALNPAERHQAFRRMVVGLTRQRPGVLVFDDVQWGWEALELAHTLQGANTPNMPVLMIVTAQTEALEGTPTQVRVEELREAPGVRAFELEPLQPADGRSMILESLALEPGLVHRISEWGGGNPLWTAQILGELVEQKLLTLRHSGFGLRSGAQIHLPRDATEVYARRLASALEHADAAGAREALWVAATIGAVVSRSEWASACARYGAHASDSLEEALLQRALARPTDEGFAFSHPLAVEAARREIPEDEAVAIHAACLAALQSLPHRDRVEDWERRAQHLRAIGRHRDAIDAMFDALERAHRVAEPGKIRVLLDTTAAWLDDLEPIDEHRRSTSHLHESRFALNSNIDACRMWARKVLGGEATTKDQRLHARALVATADRLQGDAQRAAERYAEVIAELEPGTEFLARTLLDYGLALKWLGRFDEATAHMNRSAELFGDLGHTYYQCRAVRYVGDIAFQRGEFEDAEAAWSNARRLAIEAGDRVSVAACANVFGELQRAREEFDEAAASYRHAVELFASAGHWGSVIAGFNLGLALLGADDAESARQQFETVREQMVSRALTSGIVTCDLGRAACAVRLGEWDEGRRLFDDGEREVAESSLVDRDITDLCRWIHDDAIGAGEGDLAQRAARLAADQFDSLGLEDEASRARGGWA